MSTELWTAPCTPTPVHATVTVPGSKSQTNRTLVLAGLAAARGGGASTISGAVRSPRSVCTVVPVRPSTFAVSNRASAWSQSSPQSPR